MPSNAFGIKKYLFPQSRPPSDESLEVSLPENLQILAVCENVWCCEVEVTPSEKRVGDADYGWNEGLTYSFSSSVLNEILFTLPRKETGSAPWTKSVAAPSLNSV